MLIASLKLDPQQAFHIRYPAADVIQECYQVANYLVDS